MLRSFVRHAILHRTYKSIGISEPQCRRNMQMLHMRSVRLQGKGKTKLDADMKQRIAAHSCMNNCVQKRSTTRADMHFFTIAHYT